MTDITRREVNLAAAWSAPAILAAVAAPAAQGSQTPGGPDVCVDPYSLAVQAVAGQPWKTNAGNGFTLVEGDSIRVVNTGSTTIRTTITAWTSAHQDGVRLVGGTGDTFLELTKDGNRATVEIVIPPFGQRTVQVVAPEKDAEAHVIVGCRRGFVLKSAR